jgi:putative nucleotidyltransferase with HDIG domain
VEPDDIELSYDVLPVALTRYLLAISVLGPLAALVVALSGLGDLTRRDLLWSLALLPLVVITERFMVHLTHKTNISIATATYVAMLLLLPAALPGLLALLGNTVAHLWRRSEPIEARFNVGQTALYVTLAAVAFALVRPLELGPRVGEFASLGSLVLLVLALHVPNTILVSLAGALQLQINPFRAWWSNLGMDLTPLTTLAILGVVSALIVNAEPLFFPVLILPGFLVHRSVKQMMQLRGDTHDALVALVDVIELRDPYTAGHSHRVASLARILALRLGRTAEEADVIERAGRVHDIGKAVTDSGILTKPGRLTDAEWAQMREHPVNGANVIAQFGAFREIAVLVRSHHEAWDGSGYPDGLQADAIPFGARILAVADTFDALTTDRPYRSGRTPLEALAVLQSGAGRQWDARIVAVLAGYLHDTGGQVPSHRPAPLPDPLTYRHDEAIPEPAHA